MSIINVIISKCIHAGNKVGSQLVSVRLHYPCSQGMYNASGAVMVSIITMTTLHLLLFLFVLLITLDFLYCGI